MYKVSTQTLIAYTDIGFIDLKNIYDTTNVSDEIIGIKYLADTKGIYVVSKNISIKHLRCLTLRIIVTNEPVKRSGRKGPKIVCVKIFKNGTVQLTGCRSDSHVYVCLSKTFSVLGISNVRFHLQSVMFNVSYQLDRKINKEETLKFLHEKEKINVPPLTNDSIGLKFKIPYNFPLNISKYEWTEENNFRFLNFVSYKDFFSRDSKKMRKIFGSSVTLFANGKITLSAPDKTVVEYGINWLRDVLNKVNDLPSSKIKTFKR